MRIDERQHEGQHRDQKKQTDCLGDDDAAHVSAALFRQDQNGRESARRGRIHGGVAVPAKGAADDDGRTYDRHNRCAQDGEACRPARHGMQGCGRHADPHGYAQHEHGQITQRVGDVEAQAKDQAAGGTHHGP